MRIIQYFIYGVLALSLSLTLTACGFQSRDLSQDTVVSEFLKHNRIYVSATTTPKRISKIQRVFETLDLTHVEKIILSLPQKFGRDGSEYVIPEPLTKTFDGKVQILRTEKDYGPIMKLLPAVEFLKNRGEQNAAIIWIDDDMAYPIGMINEMIYALAYHPDRAFGGSTHAMGFWWLDQGLFPPVQGQVVEHSVIEGFAGGASMVQNVDAERMKKFSSKEFNKKCFISDDLVISFSFALSNVLRSEINNEYYKGKYVKELSYAKEQDALSKGAGMDQVIPDGFDVESAKYSVCYEALVGANVEHK